MIYATLKLAHVLAIIVWIGGMVFAHFFLRPAVMSLEMPERVRVMHEVLRQRADSGHADLTRQLIHEQRRTNNLLQALLWGVAGFMLALVLTQVAIRWVG